jgi:DNA adenine methylase
MTTTTTTPPRALFKWLGSKHELVHKYSQMDLIPAEFRRYYEPFCGSASMFFYLAEAGHPECQEWHLSDMNPGVVRALTAIRDNHEALGELLARYQKIFDNTNDPMTPYLRVRADYNRGEPATSLDSPKSLQVAADFLVLSATSFNGVFRVNQSGQMNVPVGSRKRFVIYRPEALQRASELLQRTTTIRLVNAGKVINREPKKGDFVFTDPPYQGKGFDQYTAEGFPSDSHTKLAILLANAAKRNVQVLCANAHNAEVLATYDVEPLTIYEVEGVRRSVAAEPEARQVVKEVAIVGGF